MNRVLLLAILASPLSIATGGELVTTKGGMVVSVSPPATDVGVAILKAGGNAVDAAVAVGEDGGLLVGGQGGTEPGGHP